MELNKINFQLNLLIGKRVIIYLQYKLKIKGILCGFDQFLNLVIRDSVLFYTKKEKKCGTIIIRGNLILSVEPC
jgi:small nuclear ribonucleoprotein (snRNP)-like protein